MEMQLKKELTIVEIIGLVYHRRNSIILLALFFMVLSGVISFIKPKTWITTSSIISSSNVSVSGVNTLALLAGLGSSQEQNLQQYYAEIIKSADFLDTIIDVKWSTSEFSTQGATLAEMLDIEKDQSLENADDVYKFLVLNELISTNDVLSFRKEPSGLMKLSVILPDPLAAMQLNNFILNKLIDYVKTDKSVKSRNQRIFIEKRLSETEVELEKSENELRAFQEENVDLRSPRQMLQHTRLLRNVEVNTRIYLELKKQLSLVQIEEIKETEVLHVIDSAKIPVSKYGPNRTLYVIVGFFLGLVIAMIWVVISEWYAFNNSELKKVIRL
jgi:uncharacterized protein involved in exopolysaccharide biosynthesis